MEKTLKIIAWVGVVLGALAMLGWVEDTSDGYALVGGLFFIAWGIVSLNYIAEAKS